MKNQKGFILPIVIVVIVVASLGTAGYLGYQYYQETQRQPEQVFCTQEAKQCPDGSYVSRTGLNCEFAECPTPKNQTTGWKTYTSNIYDYEIQYPSEFEVTEDIISVDVSNIDHARYDDGEYFSSFEVFARGGFVLESCLKDSSGRSITKTKKVNGNEFYVFKERGVKLALKDSIAGSMESQYRIIHNNQCYIIIYYVVPINYSAIVNEREVSSRFSILDEAFSTFKFIATTDYSISTQEKEKKINGSVSQGATKEYVYTVYGDTSELEIILDYTLIGNDDIAMTVFDSKGRYIGEDFGGALLELQNKLKIPNSQSYKEGDQDPPRRISIKNPIPGIYTIKIWGVVVSPQGNFTGNFDILINQYRDETANWKTYRNEEYGFEFKYPNDWESKEKEFPLSERMGGLVLAYHLESKESEASPILVFVYDIPLSRYFEHMPVTPQYVNINGNTFLEIKLSGNYYEHAFYKDISEGDFSGFVYFANVVSDPYLEDLLSKIISTFKFIEE